MWNDLSALDLEADLNVRLMLIFYLNNLNIFTLTGGFAQYFRNWRKIIVQLENTELDKITVGYFSFFSLKE